jgi:hypothetical protein
MSLRLLLNRSGQREMEIFDVDSIPLSDLADDVYIYTLQTNGPSPNACLLTYNDLRILNEMLYIYLEKGKHDD